MKRLVEHFGIVAGVAFMAAVAAHADELTAKPTLHSKSHFSQEKPRRSEPLSLSLSETSALGEFGSLSGLPPVVPTNGYAFAPNIGRNLSTAALTLLFSGLAAKSGGNDHGIVLRFNNNNPGLIMSADGVAAQVPLITNKQPGKANLGVKFSSDRLSGLGLGLQMEWHW